MSSHRSKAPPVSPTHQHKDAQEHEIAPNCFTPIISCIFSDQTRGKRNSSEQFRTQFGTTLMETNLFVVVTLSRTTFSPFHCPIPCQTNKIHNSNDTGFEWDGLTAPARFPPPATSTEAENHQRLTQFTTRQQGEDDLTMSHFCFSFHSGSQHWPFKPDRLQTDLHSSNITNRNAGTSSVRQNATLLQPKVSQWPADIFYLSFSLTVFT